MKFTFLLAALLISVCLPAQVISTFAGTGVVGSSGNGGPASAALLYDPQTICSDNQGNIYIPDHGNHVIRKVNSAGIISIFAGTGADGHTGDGGMATAAQLGYPYGICIDNMGNIYFSNAKYQVIRKINLAGIITTIAGTPNVFGYSGDGGPAVDSTLFAPAAICADAAGNIYVTEFANSVIRKISVAGTISTVAGIGQLSGFAGDGGPATLARLSSPTGVAIDNAGNIYIADMGNSVSRKVDQAGIITTIAAGANFGYSGDGGQATEAGLKFPYFVYADEQGNVHISDTGNGAVRMVDNTGIITTIAGTGTFGYSGDGGPAISAQLTAAGGICFDTAGNMYIADAGAHVIRKIGNCELPSITLQPVDQSACEGQNITYTITATDWQAYQWQVNDGSGWVNLINNGTYAGSTGNVLSVNGILATMDDYQYRCIVSNNCGNANSSLASLAVAVSAPPSIHITAYFE